MSDTMTTSVSTIAEVVDQLEDVVEVAVEQGDRVGFFASLYRQVTVEVERAILRGAFDDGPRMSRFDAAFGNRYFAALDAWRRGSDCTAAWDETFLHCDVGDSIVLQHLILGVNAHINLDLAVAAAEVAPGAAIEDLERDFFLINDILVDVLDRVQGALNGVSPFLGLLDLVGGRTDEKILEFSVKRARAAAWESARILAHQSEEERADTVAVLDASTTRIARRVARPFLAFRPAVAVIRWSERHDVATVIRRLDAALDQPL